MWGVADVAVATDPGGAVALDAPPAPVVDLVTTEP